MRNILDTLKEIKDGTVQFVSEMFNAARFTLNHLIEWVKGAITPAQTLEEIWVDMNEVEDLSFRFTEHGAEIVDCSKAELELNRKHQGL